jgi:hypothetical protein
MPKIVKVKTTTSINNTYMLWVADDETVDHKVGLLMKKLNNKNSRILVCKYSTEDGSEKLVSSTVVSKQDYLKQFDKDNPLITEIDEVSKIDFINNDVEIYE